MINAVPTWPRLLGIAGLLPQIACLGAAVVGGLEWRYFAVAVGWAYAALIFSFLGGLWWGLAAARLASGQTQAPRWIWIASVMPSLLALASFLPWLVAMPWPGPSLVALGVAIIASLLVDRRLVGLAPDWWMDLRRPLSLGLGGLSIALGLLAP